MSDLLIRNALLFDGQTVRAGADIRISGQDVSEISVRDGTAEHAPAPHAGTQTIDARGRLVTPGWINAHTHIYSALACGIALKDEAPRDFRQILERLWWRLDRALDGSTIALSARLGAIGSLRAGVTTLFDHHASQRHAAGSLDRIADEFTAAGPRACLCFEVSDRNGPQAARAGIAENESFCQRIARAGGDHLRARFGLHASLTLSDETLRTCRQAAERRQVGFHLHIAEAPADQQDAGQRYGLRVVERFDRAGVLRPGTICAHGIHLDEREVALLAESRAHLVHCPQSNMNNAVGVADLRRLRKGGVRLALGTDGFGQSMVRESLCAHLLQNHSSSDPREGYAAVPDLLLAGNRALAAETFGLPLGRVAPGAPADLVVWDYHPATPLTSENFWGHLLHGLIDARACEVFVGGRHLLAGGRSTQIDEERLRSECTAAAKQLWERF